MTNVYTNYIFDWDDGNWPKCGKHGLLKSDIAFVLNNNPLIGKARSAKDGEQRFQAVGVSKSGQTIFIVFVVRHRKIRPISARPMHSKEVRKYEQNNEGEG